MAAEQLGLSVDAVRRYAKSGDLPTLIRIGGQLRFDLDAIQGWQPPPPRPRRRGHFDARGRFVMTYARIEELPTDGWCYLIQCVHGGPIKIGMAADVDERLRTLQLWSPYELVVRAKLEGGRRTEATLHTRFAKHRLHGEWFDDRAPGLADLIQKAA